MRRPLAVQRSPSAHKERVGSLLPGLPCPPSLVLSRRFARSGLETTATTEPRYVCSARCGTRWASERWECGWCDGGTDVFVVLHVRVFVLKEPRALASEQNSSGDSPSGNVADEAVCMNLHQENHQVRCCLLVFKHSSLLTASKNWEDSTNCQKIIKEPSTW